LNTLAGNLGEDITDVGTRTPGQISDGRSGVYNSRR
jgi:hypothetical protein